MWCLRPLSVLLLLSTVPTGSEVVHSMSDCSEFLLHKSPPNIPGILEDGNILDVKRYKPICQTYVDERRFVTLYDTENKIPVFSAYKYRGDGGSKPNVNWKIEPQLEDRQGDRNMGCEKRRINYSHQAQDKDYTNEENFDRGHLFPCSYAFSKDDKISTFTLTNIVPQAGTFNNGSWNRMENCIKCVMDKYCKNKNGVLEGFVVIGAQPNNNNNKLKNKVNIPKMLWSAFCCYSGEKKKWLASAHWGKNIADSASDKYMQTKTFEQLYDELGIGVFRSKYCPWKETVAGLYQRLNEANPDCKCPPSYSIRL
ncbi:endonuclease domain-containing 1 protein-like isoform X2 [Mastacembelus armatus]|uniref:endonuclease domain-containing 1 protein-like isoform X2 n=1 Tax=Mastacembelus armatus TaxID=205130 RepID=UPI000E45A199|nr:endonuclease domain-containing 1 protein-like isoform X2 [Mastacembelus armatus]XP_026179539.1 endonuclease domain-containing 1 protein-like isoform X2 [Mastacembelus armatus]